MTHHLDRYRPDYAHDDLETRLYKLEQGNWLFHCAICAVLAVDLMLTGVLLALWWAG